jgi:hypothetical protein
MRLGVGATVSFPVKFLHPHHRRNEKFPDPHVREHMRLTGALVQRRELKLINHKETMCVVVHHEDFMDAKRRYHRIWCAIAHVQVDKEGSPDNFFDLPPEALSTKRDMSSNSFSNDETEKTDKAFSDESHKAADPLAGTRNVQFCAQFSYEDLDCRRVILCLLFWGDISSDGMDIFGQFFGPFSVDG